MPRQYVRQVGARKYHDFSDDNLQHALNDIRNNELSLRKAAAKYGVPKSTLSRKLTGKKKKKYGRPCVLSLAEEETLTHALLKTADWGFPMSEFDTRLLVKSYLDKAGVKEPRFQNNMPGVDWVKTFLKRQSEQLKVRMSENIKRARAAVDQETIKEYFSELEVTLRDITAEAIMNYDETNLCDDPGRMKVIVRRTCKHPERLVDSSKCSVSVMFAGTASGHTLPPYIVYKADHLYQTWIEGGPRCARYNRSKSGLFEGPIFEDWFISLALPYFKTLGEGPKAIIGDNLSSHISMSVLEECDRNNIKFVLLPPNATHLCQPLDLAFFRPLKVEWRKVLEKWKSKHRGTIPKDTFPRLLALCLNNLSERAGENLLSGFRVSGIYPIDSQQVLRRLPRKISEGNNHWTATFEEFLQKKRTSETQTRKRRKKIQLAAGKSISPQMIKEKANSSNKNVHHPQPSTSDSSQRKHTDKTSSSSFVTQKRKTKRCNNEDSDTESGSDNFSVHDTSDELDFENYRAEVLNDNTDEESNDICCKEADVESEHVGCEEPLGHIQPNIDDFVIVKLLYNEGTKKQKEKMFVGQVLSTKNDETYRCKFLRCYEGKQTSMFVFPIVDDIADVNVQQILKVIFPIKVMSRGRYLFNVHV